MILHVIFLIIDTIEINNNSYLCKKSVVMSKNIKKKLRAFKIENPNLTQDNSQVIGLLKQVLTLSSTAQSRRMKLNEQDGDEDLLAFFSWQQSDNYLFGMMLRIIPAQNGGVIPDDKFNQNTISISELLSENSESQQYKDHYYFAITNEYLVTDLSGSYNIDRFQTYLNWLLESVRKNILFEITPLTIIPEGVKVSDIKSIEIGNQVNATTNNDVENNFTTRLKDLTKSAIESLFNDTDSLNDIQSDQIISAKLLITIKKKPKEMDADDYQRIMGAMTKQITNDSGITLHTKSGGKYNGEAVKKTKTVEVETTSGNRIVEEQLKQKMEQFLNELDRNE